MAKKEVQKAFVYSYEESARSLFENYLDHVEAYCNWGKVKDPVTGEEVDPDERLMRSIEEQIGISENAKKAFREEIMIRISTYARRGRALRIRFPRAAAGSDGEQAVRGHERRHPGHHLHQNPRSRPAEADQRSRSPA